MVKYYLTWQSNGIEIEVSRGEWMTAYLESGTFSVTTNPGRFSGRHVSGRIEHVMLEEVNA